MKPQEKLVLIDGNALVHRAFHALPPLSQKGDPTNAVYGFASVLLKVIRELKPDYMIATFAEKLKREQNIQCVIITGDLDTLQLVDDDHTIVYTLKKGITETMIYDEKAVRERFEGLKPSQFNDFKGLKGDPSDNIPGVPGIGEKTAIKLLLEYGSIEGIYDSIALIPKKLSDKLLEYKDQAFFSKKLATMRKDVPIEFDFKKAKFGDYDEKKVEEIFRKFGFASLIQRLRADVEAAVKKEQAP